MEREKKLKVVTNVLLVMCAPLVIVSLVYFVSQYYVNTSITITSSNVTQYAIFVVATFVMAILSLVLAWWNKISITRIEGLTKELMALQELNLELQMKYKNEIIIKVGGDNKY